MIENYNYCTIFGIERPASTCNGHVRDPWHVNRLLVERKTVENSYNCVSATSRGKLATPLRQQTSWRRAASDSVRCVVSLYVHSFATIIMLKMMTMMTMVLQQYSSSRFSVALQSKAGRLFFSFSGKPKPIVGWFVCSCFLAHKIWSFFGVAFFAPFIPFLVTRKSLSIYICTQRVGILDHHIVRTLRARSNRNIIWMNVCMHIQHGVHNVGKKTANFCIYKLKTELKQTKFFGIII